MVIQILKKLKILLILLPAVFLLLYCDDTQTPDNTLKKRAERIREESRNKDPIYTTDSEDYYGEYKSSDYEGPSCEDLEDEENKQKDYKNCKESCKKMFRQDKSKCEDLSTKLISELDKLWTSMERIRANDDQLNRRVDGFYFGVMIDISIEPVMKLLSKWSKNSDREVKEFLSWTAMNPPISLALKHHDKENEIIKSAFKKVGAGSGRSGEDSIEYGLGEFLQSGGKTFWLIATDKKNPSAFEITHNLVEDVCSGSESENCVLRFYCVREEYGRSSFRAQCRYSSERRFRRENHCYIHGPDVWSYWTHLNNKNTINNKAISDSVKMTEEQCNKVCMTCTSGCGGQNCKREL